MSTGLYAGINAFFQEANRRFAELGYENARERLGTKELSQLLMSESGPPRAALASVDLNLLIALDALLRERNVTRAGRRLGLSQPAVSHALARLRELLGDPLLIREGRAMRRTALGELLAPRVLQLLAEIDSTLLGHRTFVPADARRTFRIATNDHCGAVLIPELVARVGENAPHVDLELHAQRGQAPTEELARGELDVAVGTFLKCDPGLEVEDLFHETFSCLVRRDHPRVGKTLTLEQFVDLQHLLVAVPDYGPGVVDFALAKHKLGRRVAVRVPSFLVAPLVVARTDLILTLPTRLAALVATTHGLRLLPPPLELPAFAVQMVWRSNARDLASQWLRGQLRDAIPPMRPPAPTPIPRVR